MKQADIGADWSAPRELDIVSTLARYPFMQIDIDEASVLLDTDYDDQIIFELLRFHRLSVHAARNLNVLKKRNLPKTFRLQLVRKAVYAEQYTKEQVSELRTILEAFLKAGIDIMPIKGPATATRLYQDPYRRVLYDIDMMTRPEDTGRAVRLLESLGYVQSKPVLKSDFTDKDIDRLQNWGSNIGFRHSERDTVLIELHWRPGRYRHEFPFSTQELWEAAVQIIIAGEETLSLSPVHEALFLCVHGCKHEWKRLHWLLDIAAIAQNPHFDWTEAMSLAKARGLEQVIALSVFMAHRVFRSPIPPSISEIMQGNPSLKKRAERILKRRYSNAPKNDNVLDEVSMEWRNAGLQYGVVGRLRTILAHLTPGPDDWNWIKLPGPVSFLYYPVRLVRIIVEVLKAVMTILKPK